MRKDRFKIYAQNKDDEEMRTRRVQDINTITEIAKITLKEQSYSDATPNPDNRQMD